MHQAGDGHAVLGLGVVDAVTARDMAARAVRDVECAAQHLAGQLEGKHVARPAEQIDGGDGAPAHRVHIGEGVGRGDTAPVVGIVDDRGEEVGGRDERGGGGDTDHGGVVAGVEADE